MILLLLLLSVVVLLLLLHLDGLLHDLHRAPRRRRRRRMRMAVRVHLLLQLRRVRDDRVHQLLVVPPQFGLLMLRLLLELGGLDLSVNKFEGIYV